MRIKTLNYKTIYLFEPIYFETNKLWIKYYLRYEKRRGGKGDYSSIEGL